MATRRAILQSIPLMAAVNIVPADAREIESCEFYLKGLALAMKAIHGGEWRADINHKSKMAVVAKV